MKLSFLRRLSAFSMGLALSLAAARADDAAVVAPPPLPESPQTSPADGSVPARHRHVRHAYVLADLTQKLGLTADQQRVVGTALANARTQVRALRADESLSKEDRHQRMKDILGTARAQIRAALTPDQQKLFDAMPAGGV